MESLLLLCRIIFFLYALLFLFQGLLQLLSLLFVTHTCLVRVLKHSTYGVNL